MANTALLNDEGEVQLSEKGNAEVSKSAFRAPHASPPAIARPIKARIRPMGQQRRIVLSYVLAFQHL